MNYTNREVIKRLKQYDMFLSSLELANDEKMEERICDQLDKIEKQILLATNDEYEENYRKIFDIESTSFEAEKDRLRKLISIIEDRRDYLENRKEQHKKVTGSLVELTTFLGEDKLSTFRRRLDIIETYERNKEEQDKIMEEMKALDVKISEASRNVKANARLDDILENKMIELVSDAIDKLDLDSLKIKKDDIEEKHSMLEYALNMAKDNLRSAKELNDTSMIIECDNILSEVMLDYTKYHEKLYTLKLMNLYDKDVEGYTALLAKREELNDILKEMPGSDLYSLINDEMSKQFNTIKLQKQDLDNYEGLKKERQVKRDRMTILEDENNSKEFKIVLDDLIKTENKIREEKLRQAKKKEIQEKQAKLLEEQKLEASRIRRQKIIEETKMKEQQERLSKVKELQDNTVLGDKKLESFDIKKLDELLNPKVDIPYEDETDKKSILEEVAEEAQIDNDFWNDEVKTKDLFKYNDSSEDVSVNFDDIEYKDKKSDFDFLDDFDSFDDIPIIENNNLKPEISSKNDENRLGINGEAGEI